MHDPEKIRGRFYVLREDGWTVADAAYGNCVSFDTKSEAEGAATFCRAYCRRHGDINLESFPFSLEQPLDSESIAHLAALREENV